MNGMDEARTEQADDNRDSARNDKIDVAQIEQKVEELQNLLSDFKRQKK